MRVRDLLLPSQAEHPDGLAQRARLVAQLQHGAAQFLYQRGVLHLSLIHI